MWYNTCMRKMLFVILFVIGIGGSYIAGVYSVAPKRIVEIKVNSLNSAEILNKINIHRNKIGRESLVVDDRLCTIAYRRVQEIKKDFSHDKFEIDNKESVYTLTENIAKLAGEYDSDSTVKGWLNSPPHRHTIESSWKYTCVATSDNYAVQVFSSFDNIDHNKI